VDVLINEIVLLLRSRKPATGWTTAELTHTLGVSRARVHRALDQIRDLGYELQMSNTGAVRIGRSPDRMIDTEILAGLKTRIFAKQLHCYNRIGSTNTRAIALAESGAPEGTIVVAEEQTGGRGRLGRAWHSPSGLGIWSSVILRPQIPLQRASGLSLLAALALAQVSKRELGLKVDLKWPNDGLIGGRKVMGILTEVSAETDQVYFVVCGTGINVSHQSGDFPDTLRDSATSLALSLGHSVDRLGFYRAFLAGFEQLYRGFRRDGIGPFLEDYRKHSILLGREVVVTQGHTQIAGKAVAINDSGALVVRQGRKDMIIFAGEATLREHRPSTSR
jgi:BirA family biotin operon repressor/biotin-[acetyl-CoA-carboxylase] ligase